MCRVQLSPTWERSLCWPPSLCGRGKGGQMGTGTGDFVRARSLRAWRVVVALAALALVVAALAVAQRTPTGTGAAGSGHGDHGPALSPADRRAGLAQPVAVPGSEFKAEGP